MKTALTRMARKAVGQAGRLARIEQRLDAFLRFIENIRGEDGARVRRNALGGITISAGGGVNAETSSLAFRIVASLQPPANPNANPPEPPLFTVGVYGGSAQVLGGAEHVFDDMLEEPAVPPVDGQMKEDVEDGTYIWIEYEIWDDNLDPVCEWNDDFIFSLDKPDQVNTAPKKLYFVLGRIGKDYTGYVCQYRVGSIQAVALVNSSPKADDIQTIAVP